jgi:hypothetical protein
MFSREIPAQMDLLWQIAPRLALLLTLPDPPKVDISHAGVGK